MSLKLRLLNAKRKIFPYLFSSADMIAYLRGNGITVGEHCRFYNPSSMYIDINRPCLISIGDRVKVAAGVTILAHDYSRSVLRCVYGEVIGEAKRTIIGNNVLLGIHATLLMGAQIGDNCIVGAGAVVSGKVPPNSIVAGNPAKVIMTIDEFYQKRKARYVDEAKEYIRAFYERNGRKPAPGEMKSFWPIFAPRDRDYLKNNRIPTAQGADVEEEIIAEFMKTQPLYDGLDALIEEALNETEK